MLKVAESNMESSLRTGEKALVRKLRAYEEPTNAGIPTVGVTADLAIPSAGVLLRFKGATPLGTSAGSGEAIHLVDAVFERAEHREVIERFPGLFEEQEPGVFSFSKRATAARVSSTHDEGLEALFERSQRYGGKGCLNAVDNVLQIIAPHFEGTDLATLRLKDIDTALLGLELATARRRGKISDSASSEEQIGIMQRKQNLGMNAMLSVSLALARAIAHVRGKELYELLREEMLDPIDDLAGGFEIEVEGSQFGDYVTALREVNRILEGQGKSLFQVLRDRTGFYDHARGISLGRVAAPPHEETAPETPSATGDEKETTASPPPTPEPFSHLAVRGVEVSLPESFTEVEQETLRALNRNLYRAYVDQDSYIDIKKILGTYQQTRTDLTHGVARFGIVNNRIFKHDGCLRIPYLLGDTLLLYAVCKDSNELQSVRRFPNGTIFTDKIFDELTDVPV